MSAPQWLAGQKALIAGDGEAASIVADAIAAAGAAITRAHAATDAPEIEARFADGDFDLLVHAGVPSPAMAPEAVSLEQWRSGMSADLDSRFLHIASFARARFAAKAPGAILLLLPSPLPAAGRPADGASAGALDNLVKSLAVEWARDGIRINAIASRACAHGGVASDAIAGSLGHLAAYLLSDFAAYVTGTVSGIDET